MIVDVGYYSLLAAFVLSIFSVIACLSGIKANSKNLIESSRIAIYVVFGLICMTYISLTHAFVFDDFTVRFVAEHSSTDLPVFYKITAVWGGMEGSLLLWQIILSFFTAIVSFKYRHTNKDILPYVMIVLNIVSIFLLFLLIGWSNPLDRLYPVPIEGHGLNPLLQNPGMVFHPPSLYLGYVGYTIPFAFGMASLIQGKSSNEWILTTRRWSLIAWFFLTCGMILGGEWAYVELGWGGYWAWDPVENSSLMPWLTGTALLHSVIVQEKRNSLKIWNMLLVIATFTLSILGTFITRSGVLNSVHAFAKSPIGPAFLVFIAFIMVVAHGLLIYRQDLFASKSQKSGILSKENFFLLNNVFFVGMAFTVLYGTVFPLLAEGLADKKISIQAPFFNSIMTPLAICTVFLLGITQVLGWKKTSLDMFKKNTWIPTLLTIILMVISAFFDAIPWQLTFLGGMTFFGSYMLIRELIISTRIKKVSKNKGKEEKGFSGFMRGLLLDRRRRGGLIVHIGILILVIGLCGNFFNKESSFSLYPGEIKKFENYSLNFIKRQSFKHRNSTRDAAEIEAFENGKSLGVLMPSKSFYPTSGQPMTEVAIKRSIFKDLYISLSSLNADGSITINVYINPLVNFVWFSMLFITIGIGMSLSHKSLQYKKKH